MLILSQENRKKYPGDTGANRPRKLNDGRESDQFPGQLEVEWSLMEDEQVEVKEARGLHEVRAVSCSAMGGLVPDGSRAPHTSSVCPESGSCMAAPGWTLHLLALIQALMVAACSVALPCKACV